MTLPARSKPAAKQCSLCGQERDSNGKPATVPTRGGWIAHEECVRTVPSVRADRESSAIFQSMLRGEATTEDYLTALKAEVRKDMDKMWGRKHQYVDLLSRQAATYQWLAFAGWLAFLLTVFAAVMGWL